ncbi:hypothetical protein M408DRAFT_333274 [Serendipita vermifera MAFF 305830]|uniref:Uncharacterized protein n=1 Tax=Serendipita vermifera MAFF 305830 TaxID=933852 RepID=A0A0C3AAS2_SERVB|nr:hypothetical protein M408DRAFT_333274 [Serendipita vermifera MAFF 305830]
MPSSGEFSRVSVPTVENWEHVKDNVTKAIQAVLNDSLKEGGRDATRKAALEKELMEWRDRMFELATPNLRVNGQNFEEYIEKPKHLPFDEALDRTVIALREQALVSEQTIAERRRTVPSKVHDLLADLLERQRAAEISLSAAEVAASEGIDEHAGSNIDLLAQHAQLDEVMSEAETAAKQLNVTVPHLLQRAQWAQEVSAELASPPNASHGTR